MREFRNYLHFYTEEDGLLLNDPIGQRKSWNVKKEPDWLDIGVCITAKKIKLHGDNEAIFGRVKPQYCVDVLPYLFPASSRIPRRKQVKMNIPKKAPLRATQAFNVPGLCDDSDDSSVEVVDRLYYVDDKKRPVRLPEEIYADSSPSPSQALSSQPLSSQPLSSPAEVSATENYIDSDIDQYEGVDSDDSYIAYYVGQYVLAAGKDKNSEHSKQTKNKRKKKKKYVSRNTGTSVAGFSTKVLGERLKCRQQVIHRDSSFDFDFGDNEREETKPVIMPASRQFKGPRHENEPERELRRQIHRYLYRCFLYIDLRKELPVLKSLINDIKNAINDGPNEVVNMAKTLIDFEIELNGITVQKTDFIKNLLRPLMQRRRFVRKELRKVAVEMHIDVNSYPVLLKVFGLTPPPIFITDDFEFKFFDPQFCSGHDTNPFWMEERIKFPRCLWPRVVIELEQRGACPFLVPIVRFGVRANENTGALADNWPISSPNSEDDRSAPMEWSDFPSIAAEDNNPDDIKLWKKVDERNRAEFSERVKGNKVNQVYNQEMEALTEEIWRQIEEFWPTPLPSP